MCVSKQLPEPKINIKLGDQPIAQVSSCNYILIGAMITADGTTKKEIHGRIALAKDACNKLRNILTNRKLSLKIKIRVLKTYTFGQYSPLRCRSLDLDSRNSTELRSSGDVVLSPDAEGFVRPQGYTNEEILRRDDMKRELLKTLEKTPSKVSGTLHKKREARRPLPQWENRRKKSSRRTKNNIS